MSLYFDSLHNLKTPGDSLPSVALDLIAKETYNFFACSSAFAWPKWKRSKIPAPKLHSLAEIPGAYISWLTIERK